MQQTKGTNKNESRDQKTVANKTVKVQTKRQSSNQTQKKQKSKSPNKNIQKLTADRPENRTTFLNLKHYFTF